VLLALLLGLTNWLHILPMDWLHIIYRPPYSDSSMLTSPNIPLKLYLSELRGYPDVNRNIVDFIQGHAQPGDTVLATYGDLPLQFYTSLQVTGGLQGRVPSLEEPPDWVVKREKIRRNRSEGLAVSEQYIRDHLRLEKDYEKSVLPHADERYGNRPDPYHHRFVPPKEPFEKITVFRRVDA
jgi:hypothetical protein